MVTSSQIRKIHTLKSIIGLDDDLYRDILKSFDVLSSKDLTFAEAKILIEIFEDKAISMHKWTKQPVKYQDLERTDNMATQAQLRMIEGMWREICYFDNDEYAKKSLRKFLRSKFRVDDIMFLTKSKAIKVIQAIKNIQKNINKCGRTVK